MLGFLRALRRAGLPLAFSQGFHPRVRMQFEDPLPLGWSSDQERFWVELVASYPAREFHLRLNAMVPPGLTVQRVYLSPAKPRPVAIRLYEAVGDLPSDLIDRVPDAFPVADDEVSKVQLTVIPGGYRFLLSVAQIGQPLSLKKVLRMLGVQEEAFATLVVHRHHLAHKQNSA